MEMGPRLSRSRRNRAQLAAKAAAESARAAALDTRAAEGPANAPLPDRVALSEWTAAAGCIVFQEAAHIFAATAAQHRARIATPLEIPVARAFIAYDASRDQLAVPLPALLQGNTALTPHLAAAGWHATATSNALLAMGQAAATGKAVVRIIRIASTVLALRSAEAQGRPAEMRWTAAVLQDTAWLAIAGQQLAQLQKNSAMGTVIAAKQPLIA